MHGVLNEQCASVSHASAQLSGCERRLGFVRGSLRRGSALGRRRGRPPARVSGAGEPRDGARLRRRPRRARGRNREIDRRARHRDHACAGAVLDGPLLRGCCSDDGRRRVATGWSAPHGSAIASDERTKPAHQRGTSEAHGAAAWSRRAPARGAGRETRRRRPLALIRGSRRPMLARVHRRALGEREVHVPMLSEELPRTDRVARRANTVTRRRTSSAARTGRCSTEARHARSTCAA